MNAGGDQLGGAVMEGTNNEPPQDLTERERDILQRLADGWISQAIASELGVTERTVFHYVGTAKQKLGCTTRSHLIATAVKRGLIK